MRRGTGRTIITEMGMEATIMLACTSETTTVILTIIPIGWSRAWTFTPVTRSTSI